MAWSWVGISASVESTTTAITLAEPAGVADGDLLVACFASRTTATTAITNTGWTAVNSQNNNNALTNSTSAVASGTMLYQVRAGAPDLSFVIPAGISVCLGRIVAYRGGATTGVLDVSQAVTTAVATTAVSVAGVAPTVANDLIVAMCAGGQEAAWSAFNNVTTPIGSSGTGSSITAAPSASAWQERADIQTTGGNDTSLAIFDAVRTAASTTGNLTATASLGGGHVVVAGAFKIYVAPGLANAWNSADKSANVTLSNSDKTATTGGTGGVRSTTTHDNGVAGKYYIEIVLAGTAVPTAVGIMPTTATLTANTSSIAMNNVGQIIINAGLSGIDLGTPVVGDVVGVAWDAGAERVWFRLNADNWNVSATANPATDAEGVDASFAASTAHALWMRAATTGPAATIRTELAEFTQAVPYGFLSWMGEALTIADAWNVNDKSGTIALSNVDKTATSTVTGVTAHSTQKWLNETAGKYYAEFKIDATSGTNRFGLQVDSAGLGSVTDSIAVSTFNGAIQISGSGSSPTVGGTPVANDVICMAWDAGAERIWFRLNGGLWNNDASASPASNTNGLDISATIGAVNVALMFYAGAVGASVTVRTGVAEYTQAVPSGFLSWMGPPAFRSQSTIGYASRTNTVLTAPAGIVNGDILILSLVLAKGGGPPTPTLPAGFTVIDSTSVFDGEGGGAFNAVFRVAWKRAASESGSYTITHADAPSQAVMTVYSNCIATGSPVDAYSKNSATWPVSVHATATAPGITTTAVGTTLLFIDHNWTGSGVLSPPTGFTERFDNLVCTSDKAWTTAGATGDVSHATGNAAGEPWAAFLVALKSVGSAAVAIPGVKVWSGSAWVEKPAKVWSGSAWTQKPVKTWNGSAWT